MSTGELMATMNSILINSAVTGSYLRELKRVSGLSEACRATGFSETEGAVLIQLIDALEQRIRNGSGLVDAIGQLRLEGWLDKVTSHRLTAMGV